MKKLFETLFENNPAPMAISSDHQFIEVNLAFLEIFGYPRQEVIGKSLFELGLFNDAEIYQQIMGEINTTGRLKQKEIHVICQDGRIVDGMYSGEIIEYNDRQCLLSVLVDITEIKALNLRIEQERQRLFNVIEGTNIGTWEWNITTGETIYNERWAEIIGYTLAELQPVSISTWEKFAHPDDLIKSSELLQQHFARRLEFYESESRMKHKNGSWIWVLDKGKVVEWDSDGRPLKMFGTHTDITEFKQREESEHFFAVSPDLLLIADYDCHALKLSRSWTTVLGYQLEEIENQVLYDFVHPEDLAATRLAIGGIIANQEITIFTNRYRCKDGSYRFLEWRLQPFAGKIFATARDITELKLKQTELQERVKELTCLHNVSRMIANPGLSEDVFCAGVATSLNLILHHPEHATTVIEIRGRRYQSGPVIDPNGESLECSMVVNDRTVGRIAAYHPAGTAFLLPFEQNLVNNLASMLSLWVQSQDYKSEMHKFVQAVDQCGTNIVITNTFGIIEYVNQAFLATTGYTKDEVIGQNPRFLQSGLTPAETYEDLWRTIFVGQTWRGEFCNRTKTGELYWEIASVSCIRDQHGKITHFLGVKEDITARKHDQERIADALAFNKTILDSSPFGILIYKASGRCISANAAAGVITGKTHEELLAHDFHASKSWKASGLYRAAMKTLETGDPVSAAVHCQISTGRELWLNYTFNPFMIGGELHLLHMFQDDSLRQKAEEELKLTNEKLEVIVKDLEVSRNNSDLLRQLGDMLQICHEVKEAFDIIEPFIPSLFPDSTGTLYMLDANLRTVSAVLSWGGQVDSDPVFSLENCWSLRSNQTHFTNTALPGPKCKYMDESFSGIYLDLPLTASGETIGLFHLEWSGLKNLPTQVQSLAQIMTEHIALALANIRLRERLVYQSVRDPLTGAFNRRYMEETLAREVMRARRYNKSLGLMMIDIDYFKKFNDTYGHAAGDLVLKNLSTLLATNVRTSDIVCRMGGEEFLVILTDASSEIVHERAESIRQAVAALKLVYDDQPLGPMTVSIGVAMHPEQGSSEEVLLRRADDALYLAKNSGRNRVETAMPALPSP